MPFAKVSKITSSTARGGVGETLVSVTAPALVNALFKPTGTWLPSLNMF